MSDKEFTITIPAGITREQLRNSYLKFDVEIQQSEIKQSETTFDKQELLQKLHAKLRPNLRFKHNQSKISFKRGR